MMLNLCPSCGNKNDAVTAAFGDATPHPGDLSICLYCGHLMVFADDLSLRALTDEEMHEVAGMREMLAVQRAREKIK